VDAHSSTVLLLDKRDGSVPVSRDLTRTASAVTVRWTVPRSTGSERIEIADCANRAPSLR
jgi:hypothetical protein